MAAPLQSAASSSSEDDDGKEQGRSDEELDFCSPKFNPLKALSSPDIKIPFANVKTFTSLASYEAALKNPNSKSKSKSQQTQNSSKGKSLPGRGGSTSRASEGTSTNVDRSSKYPSGGKCTQDDMSKFSKTHTQKTKESGIYNSMLPNERPVSNFRFGANMGMQRGRGRNSMDKKPEIVEDFMSYLISPSDSDTMKRNVLTRMAQMSGPLELLARCVRDRLHVRVMTRAAVTVRSICRGYILAFDKCYNMALIDVDEIYRRPACLGKIRARRTHKLQAAQTTLKEERDEQRTRFKQFTQIKGGEESKDTKKESTGNDSAETKNLAGPVGMIDRGRKSVYDGVPIPYSNFEREALMLGIPDENVDHRHVNQLFIRGENVVLVSIID